MSINRNVIHSKTKNPKVSVIVPVYKVDKYLTQCLQSIVEQTLEEIEIIVIDEGDEDRCREIIDYFEKRDPRIVAPHRINGGYGASCNFGIDLAKGEYIGFVESDDFIDKTMYEEMYAFAKLLDADVVKTPFYEFSDIDGDHLYYPSKYLSEQMPKDHLFAPKDFPQQLAFHPSTWSGIYKREYINSHGLRYINQKGASYVDCVFRAKAVLETSRMAWLDRAYYHWRITSEGSTTNNWKIQAILTRWNEVHKYLHENIGIYDEEHIVPFMLKEEYINTVGSILEKDITVNEAEWKLLEENLSYITDTEIENAYLLDGKQKTMLALAKKDISKFKMYVKRYHFNRYLFSKKTILEKATSSNSMVWYVSGLITLWTLNNTFCFSYYSSLLARGIVFFTCVICFCFFYKIIIKKVVGKWIRLKNGLL